MKGRGSATIEKTLSYAVLGALAIGVLFPFYWMTITSFKTEEQMRSIVSMFWPKPFAVENYQQLLAKTEFAAWYGNSVFVAVSSTLLATAVGTIGAYALARLKFLGRGFMASATLITYLVPPSILFIPLYKQMQGLGMANSLSGLIAASSSSIGIDSKYPIKSHVTNGTVNDGYVAIRPARLSESPNVRICA